MPDERAVNCGSEIILETALVRIRREPARQGRGACLVKEFLGANALQRLHHERRILERLRALRGVPQLAQGDFPSGVLPLVDYQAVPLALLLGDGRLGTSRLLDLALQLTEIVASIHGAGVAHKSLCLEQILSCAPGNGIMIGDFSLATTFAEERPSFVHHRDIVGALPYLAPEQTGRTGRPVDYRADLYGLGATLYRIATGVLPFAETDPLQLIHDILAQAPTPPSDFDPSLPQGLSRLILRLLQKEPDRRYQSAEGVAYDLRRLREAHAAGKQGDFTLGERDFPLKLSPPSRLVGRDSELATLHEALDRAFSGGGGCLLVAGAPGVGKTALINELRPMVAARRGWFVSGKFDQYRRDLESDAVRQAMSALGRLLLAEPEAQLAPLRERLLLAQGPNAGLTADLVPEFAAIVGTHPQPVSHDALQHKERLVQGGVEILRAVVSPERPVVLVLDDLQWAAPTPLGLVDVLMTEGIPGLFFVGAYRHGEVDAVHPFAPILSRWSAASSAPPLLQLGNLSPTDLTLLLRQMLRLRQEDAAALAAAIGERTGGNPYETVELVNALRQEGILRLDGAGWSWDCTSIRRYVGSGDVCDLISSRIGRFPCETQALVETIACLGGEVRLSLLEVGSGLHPREIEARLVPALEDGLLVLESEDKGTVFFRHDRVQQAAYGRLATEARLALHLALGRRLAAVPEFLLLAAEQYLPVVHLLEDREECREVISLFRHVAGKLEGLNFALVERLLSAARLLLQRIGDESDEALFVTLETELHAALYSLARLEEADEVYASVALRCADPVQLSAAACLQVCSLTNRGRPAEAVALGLSLIGALGVVVPPLHELPGEIDRGLDRLERWVAEVTVEGDLLRPEVDDPRILAMARLMNRMIPPSFFSGQQVTPWLFLTSHRLWMEHGPSAALVGPASHATFITVELRDDFLTGYRAVRHVLAVSEARGYEPDTSQSRFLFTLTSGIWFHPLEENVLLAQRSHEGLVLGGDLQNAGFTYFATVPPFFEYAESLEAFAAGVEPALAFLLRTGNAHCYTNTHFFVELVQKLGVGEATPAAGALPLEGMNGTVASQYHCCRALAATFFWNPAELVPHAAEALRLMPYLAACYPITLFHLLHALALAHQVRCGVLGAHDAPVAELHACREWMARRAADAPDNFLHLVHFIDAERAWALGDAAAALRAYESAMAQVERRQRPWHRALITERAACCHFAHGLERSGRHLLSEARDHYRGWGAQEKVRQLEEAHPHLRGARPALQPEKSRYGVSSDAVDMLAVLRGSQALSSETSLERLRAQVVALLETMTGATGVSLVLQQEEGGWHLLPPEVAEGSRSRIPLDEAVRSRLLPVAVFRYLERTRHPLLVHDAKRDDRFGFDPYFFPLECCSLLALPIANHGVLRAVLLLENRLSRGAFTDEGLDAVQLMAGQLAVSLENALLYEKLEERVRQRTAELSAAQSELMATARQAGMAEIATNVLHNVGNVLNSVNISAGVVMNAVSASKGRDLGKVVHLLREHAGNLGGFFTADARGQLLPAYLEKLSRALEEEQQGVTGELERLVASVDHIKEIVAAQQSYAGSSSITEPTRISDLVEDALRMHAGALRRNDVTVVRELADLPPIPLNKARVLQILVNLISNAEHAIKSASGRGQVMTLRTEVVGGRLRIGVVDEGEGIAPENLSRIFSHGFTTRRGGHGFGLHSCALAAKEMGGTLTAHSEGVGKGAVFTLELPVWP